MLSRRVLAAARPRRGDIRTRLEPERAGSGRGDRVRHHAPVSAGARRHADGVCGARLARIGSGEPAGSPSAVTVRRGYAQRAASASTRCAAVRRTGHLLEHLVAHELHARLGELWPEARLHHFRRHHGAEVNFVVETGRELWAIEVKASRTVGAHDLTGLRALSDRVSAVRRWAVVYPGPRRQRMGDI